VGLKEVMYSTQHEFQEFGASGRPGVGPSTSIGGEKRERKY